MLAKFLYYISEGLLLPSDVDNINVIKNKISYSIERKVSDVITDFSITIKVEKFDQTITEKEGMPHLIDKSVFQNVDELANQLINELSWFSHSKNSIPVEILKKDGPEYIPETENEEDNLKILKWSLNETYPHKQVILSQADFSLLIDNKDKYREIFLAKSFHNEGIKYYHKFEYLKAFQNFYFVIEYYYSGGRSKNKGIKEEFRNNPKLQDCLKRFINNPKDLEKINVLWHLTPRYNQKPITVHSLSDWLVDIRGQLFHLIKNDSRQLRATVFNQEKYQILSYLTLSISLMAILFHILRINTGKNIE